MSDDTLERISHVLGIYEALHMLLSSREYADRWVKEANAAFSGAPALDRILAGFTGLLEVRHYLDSERAW